MQKRTENSRKFARLTALLGVLGLVGALSVPAAAGADASGAGAMSLVFSSGQAHETAGNLAVPVQCFGSGASFCSGVVTLSRSGHHTSIPFSVRGGGKEVLFVPLRLGGHADHVRKVHGVASTTQSLGPATRAKQFLYAR